MVDDVGARASVGQNALGLQADGVGDARMMIQKRAAKSHLAAIAQHPRLEHVTLIARNNAGASAQEFDVEVACTDNRGDVTGFCTCGSGGGGLLGLAWGLYALLGARRRARRGRTQ